MPSKAIRTPPYLPFMEGPPDFAPKLKPIAPESWLLPDTEAEDWLAAKRKLMVSKRREVACGDLNGAPAQELLDLVQGHVPALLENGWPSALEGAASLVADDLCLLEEGRAQDWRLIAGVLCAPTYWTLPERIGLDLGGLHGPVPGGDPELAGRIGRMFTRLEPGIVLERLNWTVQTGGARYTPERPDVAGAGVSDLFLRVERQTVRKLPETRAAVFTIRICMDPLMPILEDADRREAFEDAWITAPAHVRAYKGWTLLEPLVKKACRRTSLRHD
ncbi:MAG: DUF3445 domain-containing protein [Henriciella sp.]